MKGIGAHAGKVLGRLNKVRHAGLRNAAAAGASRLRKRLAATGPGARLFPLPGAVDMAVLRQAIARSTDPGQDLAACFIQSARARHFLDDAAASAACVRAAFPDAVPATIAVADAICAHRFHFLGREVEFGPEIDWQWNPDGAIPWPLVDSELFRYRHSYFRDDRPGDVKHPWELHRHQYFMTLAKAYLHTGDERYAEAFAALVLSWTEANPYGKGLGWYGSMEFGIRIISWANAFAVFRGSPHFVAHGLEPFLCGLYAMARRLAAFLTTDWLVPTNHLIGETAGLFVFSVCFPQFRESARWRRKALRIFVREVERQIFRDGVNKEQATGYHRFVVDFILLVMRLGELNGVALPPVLRERLEAMLEYEQHVLPPDNRVPQVGDCDDGRGVLLGEHDAFFDFRGWQAVGAVWFGRDDFARAAAGGTEEAVWLLGPDGWRAFQAMRPGAEPRASRLFPEGGQAILRTGDGPRDSYVHTRCGPFGLGGEGSSGHSHADMLALAIHWNGLPLAVDSGTYAYYCATDERDAFRRTAAHNTIAPDDVELAAMHRLKNWGAVPRTQLLEWTPVARGGTLRARMESPGGYIHERAVCLEPGRLMIHDQLAMAPGRAAGPVVWRLHLHPDCDARADGGLVHIVRDGRPFARLTFDGFNACSIDDTWYAPSYGVKQRNRCVTLTKEGSTAEVSVTLMDDTRRPAS